jgi:uncharacterized protein
MNTIIDGSQVLKKHKGLSLRRLILILVLLLLLLGIVVGVVGYIFSNTLLSPVHQISYTLEVTNVSAHSVTLPRTPDTEKPGLFDISWAGGQAAIVGNIISKTKSTVTRQLEQSTAPLANHTMVSFDRNVYMDGLRSMLGLSIKTVEVADPLGQMPAMYVSGKLDTWAIVVHGRGDTLEADMRFFPPLAKLGLPILGISYRNDLNAPASPDGLYHLGDSEWQDVQAAVQYAMAHGARHIVLYGFSMGGATVESFMRRSAYASYVQALILDAPVLDWNSTLILQAANYHMPAFMANIVEFVTTLRTGINFNSLDQLDQNQGKTPILLFHGTADTTTPVSVSDAFAKAHPDIVTYYRVNGANHVESWNHNPQLYDSEVISFLSSELHLQ